jgi:stage V sporulation protein G
MIHFTLSQWMRAIAVSIVFDDCFAVHGVKIIRRPEGGWLVVMPSRNAGGGVFLDIASPMDVQTRNWIETSVLSEYAKIVASDCPRKKRRKQIH